MTTDPEKPKSPIPSGITNDYFTSVAVVWLISGVIKSTSLTIYSESGLILTYTYALSVLSLSYPVGWL